MRTKTKLFFFGISLFFITFSNAWGASGTITITSPDPGQVFKTTSSFSVLGTAVLTEDSTPNNGGYWYYYWDWIWAFPIYAKVMWQLDDNQVSYRNELRYISRVGEQYNFALYNVNVRNLDPAVTHTITIYFQDIYGRGNPPSLGSYQGNAFGHATLTFKIVKPCDLKIDSFTRSMKLIDPSKGENVTFSGSMTETSGADVQWTMKITDSSGAQWKTFSGTGKSPSISWDGKDSYGRIADDGLYTATLEARTEDGKCKKTASAQVTVKSSCGDIRISSSENSVRPAHTGQANSTKAAIGIGLSKPAPSSGCEVRLRVEAEEGSGGHDHIDGRTSHTGALSSDFVFFVEGETDASVEYTSGEVAGTENIIAELVDENGTVLSTRSLSIDVKVPELSSLGGSENYILTGDLPGHSSNHYGQFWTNWMIGHMAFDYWYQTGGKIGINDMSLVWGGVFDYKNTWSPPHHTHRTGQSVDIDRCADNILVKQRLLDKIARNNGGTRIVERSLKKPPCEGPSDTPRLHYDFR